MSLKEKLFEKQKLNQILHTTFNPYEPGVARIHLVPSKFSWVKSTSSVVILNGHDIIPVQEAWTILLATFIEKVNAYEGKEVTDEEVDRIVDSTVQEVRRVYGKRVKEEVIKSDLWKMINTFESIALGKEPETDIAPISIGEYSKFMTAPHRMDLMISSMQKGENWNCNQKCIHCYAAGQKEAIVEELDTDKWKKIIDKCKEARIPQLTFTGGEPTMRKDLVELIDYSRWFVTRLNTNGVLLSKELCKQLYEASLDSVQITLYSNEADVHNKLVGANNFDKTIEGIKNAIEAGLNVSINTPICKLNKKYKETLVFLNELGVKYVSCSGLIVTGNAKTEKSKETQLESEELYQILEEAVTYCNDNLIEISFTSPGWIKNEKIRELRIDVPSCGACLSNMAIAPNGDVIPCQSWLSENAKLGNMLDTNWKQIWSHNLCKRIRKNSSKMEGICPLRYKNNQLILKNK